MDARLSGYGIHFLINMNPMKYLSWFLLLCLPLAGLAQPPELRGYVANEQDELLPGATVAWEGTTNGVVTGPDGDFSITRPDTTAVLIIQYVGYDPYRLSIRPDEQDIYITLSGVQTLQEVQVTSDEKGVTISTLDTRYVENVSRNELRKAACCNLAESFETNASVDVGMTNAITGASEVQMLGLRGIYTQLLVENRTALNGLAQPFALDYIPGTWVESIQISKGASSVANGHQSITGQINTELVKPGTDDPVFANAYINSLGRLEGNLHLNRVWKPSLSTGMYLHASGLQKEWDGNEDGFLDTPRKAQFNGMYRMFYSLGRLEGQFNVQGIRHRQEGGQLSSIDHPWRLRQDNDRVEVWGKNGVILHDEHESSIGFIYNAYRHVYQGRYGDRDHHGDQNGLYLNLLFNTRAHDPAHKFSGGISHQLDDIREDLFGTSFDRRDEITGAFAQYTYGNPDMSQASGFSFGRNAGLILGVRADHHRRYGWFITPRINLRLNLDMTTVIRLSAGRGWRTPNFPPDWQSMLFNNWTVQTSGSLKPEDAWVYGINLTKSVVVGSRVWSFVFDAFHTRFVNQVIMDMESSHTVIQLYNLDGRSFSNSLLAMVNLELAPGLSCRLAWKYNEVKTTYQGVLKPIPMVPLHRLLATVDYITPDKSWAFNLTGQGVGSMRLPSHNGFPPDVIANSPEESPAYLLLNGQVTWSRKRLAVYLGGENLGNFTQRYPIVDWTDPASEHFDATRVFGPVIGARAYLGVRFAL